MRGMSHSAPTPRSPARRPRGGVLARGAVLTLALLLAAASVSCSAPPTAVPLSPHPILRPTPRPTTPIGPGFQLAFAEEFDGEQLDPSRWKSGMPWADHTLGEAATYRQRGLSLGDGILTMTATNQQSGGRPYTSGAINSDHLYQFTYGYAEVRAKIPRGRGLWPAFWLLSTGPGTTGEIDVFEVLGHEPERTHMTLHLESGPEKSEEGTSWVGPDFSAAFHTYAVDWEPEHIVWYVDGVERFRSKTDVPIRPMCLIANLAVGGPTSWPGPPDAQTPLPASLEIDYIRVFQRR
jgi:beta-glucanase (GH16 family)